MNEKTFSDEENKDESTWAHDQEKHDYYYDDTTGYELYNPDEDSDENEDEEK
jgi:hypothetical protein